MQRSYAAICWNSTRKVPRHDLDFRVTASLKSQCGPGESSSVSVIPYKLIGGLQQWVERLRDIHQTRCEFTELVDESHERSQIGAVRWHWEVVDGCNLVVIDSETLVSDMESTEIHFSHTELELLRADGDAVLPSTCQDLSHMLNVTSKVGVIRQAIIHDLSKVRHLFKSTVGPAVEFIASGNQTLRIPQKTVPAPWCHERRERDGSFRQRDLPIPMTGIQLREKLGIADIRHDVTRCARRVCWSSDLVVQFF